MCYKNWIDIFFCSLVEFDNLFIEHSFHTKVFFFFLPKLSSKERTNVWLLFLSFSRSIDFTSLIYGCTPSKVLFSYLLIHQESNQICHLLNACPMSHPHFFFLLTSLSLSTCAKYSYRISELLIDRKSIIFFVFFFRHILFSDFSM